LEIKDIKLPIRRILDRHWNIDSFFEANIGLTDDVPQFNLFDNDNKIYTRPRLLPPSKFKKIQLKNR
jgi:glucose-1-phosphate adenylyltransferase